MVYMMRDSASSYRLYAYCDESKNICEDLVEHLSGVAECSRRCAEALGLDNVAKAICIAGLLHDIGKAVKGYQDECRFQGHEIVSVAIAMKILDGVHLDPLHRSLILYAIAAHHQALRPVAEVIDRAREIVRTRLMGSGLRSLIDRAKNICGIDLPDIEIEIGEQDISRTIGEIRFASIVERQTHSKALEILGVMRTASGCVIVCDNFVAYRNRGGVSALGGATSWFYTWIQRRGFPLSLAKTQISC